jgi:hypothetical protein
MAFSVIVPALISSPSLSSRGGSQTRPYCPGQGVGVGLADARRRFDRRRDFLEALDVVEVVVGDEVGAGLRPAPTLVPFAASMSLPGSAGVSMMMLSLVLGHTSR